MYFLFLFFFFFRLTHLWLNKICYEPPAHFIFTYSLLETDFQNFSFTADKEGRNMSPWLSCDLKNTFLQNVNHIKSFYFIQEKYFSESNFYLLNATVPTIIFIISKWVILGKVFNSFWNANDEKSGGFKQKRDFIVPYLGNYLYKFLFMIIWVWSGITFRYILQYILISILLHERNEDTVTQI